jgi:hypothetical protein
MSSPTAADVGVCADVSSGSTSPDVVEIGLLLPANWANSLIALSKLRHESVGQILRSIIGRALHEEVPFF